MNKEMTKQVFVIFALIVILNFMCCKKNFAGMVLIILAAAAILAVMFCFAIEIAWLLENRQAVIRPSIMLGGDRDGHGCIGSAGYSWCEAKQKCLRAWEKPCQAENSAQALPDGYTLDSYEIKEALNISCQKDADCATPGEYLAQSNCPYTSLCLKNKCTVVCPGRKQPAIVSSNWQIYRNENYGVEYKYPGAGVQTPWSVSIVKKPMLNIMKDKTAFNTQNCYISGGSSYYEYVGNFLAGNVSFCVNKKIESGNNSKNLSLYYSTSKDNVYYTFLFYTDCFVASQDFGCASFDENQGKRWAEAIVSTFKFIN